MGIPYFTKEVFDKFDDMRGKTVNSNDFWDLVVLTASDEAQACAYRQQIESKLAKKELPIGIEYIVYSDPPGPKIGCGGSTMFVISELYKSVGEKLWEKRILLLNAGGQSQRLPSSSILGKIFMAFPIRDPMYQLFDLKLACYLPFLKHMKPGIFHASSDTVESYDLGDNHEVTFERPGFTAVAHPSSLQIGCTHGVYVLEEQDESHAKGENSTHNKKSNNIARMRNCLEVLQKPSIERMREKGAILSHPTTGDDMVYTDSSFFFDHEISKKFLRSYREKGIKCEIDSYGDFLQGLGPRASDDYTKDVKNVSKVESILIETRKRIFELLKNTPLHIVCLESSKFYHFGTMPEYVENFTRDPVIAEELGYEKAAFCLTEGGSADNNESDAAGDDVVIKKQKLNPIIEGSVMHSIFRSGNIYIGSNSVIEYCQFEVPFHLKENCVVSNCQVLTAANKGDIYTIRENVFLHSAWIQHNGVSKAVTIALGVNDNVKKKVDKLNPEQLHIFGESLPPLIERAGSSELSFSDDDVCSLWTAKIFPAASSMTESFHKTYSMFFGESASNSVELEKNGVNRRQLFSIQEVVEYKDVRKMLSYRDDLYEEITKK